MDGSATFTTDTSRMTMNWAAIMRAKIVHGRRGSSAAIDGASWVAAAGAAAGWADMAPPRKGVGGRLPRSPRTRSLTPVKSPGIDRNLSDPLGTVLLVLAGRDTERSAIAALLEDARKGHGGALVVRGVAGSGKSTLLADALRTADDMRLLRTSGVESESPLAFAALHRLLWPLRSGIDALPAPQAAALRAAMGEAEGDGERFLTFLGTLSLLADAAESSPRLVVVDDAHWLADAWAAALLSAARRLPSEPAA